MNVQMYVFINKKNIPDIYVYVYDTCRVFLMYSITYYELQKGIHVSQQAFDQQWKFFDEESSSTNDSVQSSRAELATCVCIKLMLYEFQMFQQIEILLIYVIEIEHFTNIKHTYTQHVYTNYSSFDLPFPRRRFNGIIKFSPEIFAPCDSRVSSSFCFANNTKL